MNSKEVTNFISDEGCDIFINARRTGKTTLVQEAFGRDIRAILSAHHEKNRIEVRAKQRIRTISTPDDVSLIRAFFKRYKKKYAGVKSRQELKKLAAHLAIAVSKQEPELRAGLTSFLLFRPLKMLPDRNHRLLRRAMIYKKKPYEHRINCNEDHQESGQPQS